MKWCRHYILILICVLMNQLLLAQNDLIGKKYSNSTLIGVERCIEIIDSNYAIIESCGSNLKKPLLHQYKVEQDTLTFYGFYDSGCKILSIDSSRLEPYDSVKIFVIDENGKNITNLFNFSLYSHGGGIDTIYYNEIEKCKVFYDQYIDPHLVCLNLSVVMEELWIIRYSKCNVFIINVYLTPEIIKLIKSKNALGFSRAERFLITKNGLLPLNYYQGALRKGTLDLTLYKPK